MYVYVIIRVPIYQYVTYNIQWLCFVNLFTDLPLGKIALGKNKKIGTFPNMILLCYFPQYDFAIFLEQKTVSNYFPHHDFDFRRGKIMLE